VERTSSISSFATEDGARIALYEWQTDERYWNQIGPFGGWIAAALLRPVLDHPERHGSPLSITINFAAAIRAGRYDVRVELLRRNRSTSFWFVRFLQEQDGETVHCADATVVLAVRRPMMSFAIAKPPPARAPEWPACLSLSSITSSAVGANADCSFLRISSATVAISASSILEPKKFPRILSQ